MFDTNHNNVESYQMTQKPLLPRLGSQETPKHNFNS